MAPVSAHEWGCRKAPASGKRSSVASDGPKVGMWAPPSVQQLAERWTAQRSDC